jgi:DNA-binding LacI/PurR family transcriptional regulator/DNA-binding transcriptional regulator YhcF (GntR family)
LKAKPISQLRSLPARVAQNLRDKIDSGELKAGALLPGRRSLAEEYEVSVVTVEQAMKELIADGLLRAETGRGTFVSDSVASSRESVVFPSTTADTATAIASPRESHSRRSPLIAPVIGIVCSVDMLRSSPGLLESPAFWIVTALERAIHKLGATAIFRPLGPGDGWPQPFADVGRTLVEAGCDAVVYVEGCSASEAASVQTAFESMRVPCAFIGSEILPAAAYSVCYSNFEAGSMAASHLLQRGHREIMFFSAVADRWVRDRYNGVRDAVSAAGLPADSVRASVLDLEAKFPPPNQTGPDWQEVRAYDAAREWLQCAPLVRAVVADNDRAAYGFMRAAAQLGYNAGEHYAIIGFDDLPPSRVRGLSSIYLPLEAMGREGARLVMAAIEDEAEMARVTLKCNLIARSSTELIGSR